MTRVTTSETASLSETPNQPRIVPTAVVLKNVTKAATVSAAPNPMASRRSRASTQTKKVWSSGWSARSRNAMRSEPTAPIAAPMRPTRARMPAMLSVSGWIRSSGSMSPSSPMRPGMAAPIVSTRASIASGRPESQMPPIAKPRNTPAKTEKRVR